LPTQLNLDLIETQGLHAGWIGKSGLNKIGPTRRPWPQHRSLVVEYGGKFILIDPGLGLFDWVAPVRRLGVGAGRLIASRPRPQTLRPLLEQRGISPDQVTDVVLSSLRRDVCGAVSDFPHARVHALCPPRHEQALPQFAHQPQYVPPLEPKLDWHSFKSRRANLEIASIHLLEMPGHRECQAGVLIESANGFVLYLNQSIASLDELTAPTPPSGLAQWARLLTETRPFEALLTRERLRRLIRHPPSALTLVMSGGPTAQVSVGPTPHPSIGFR